MLVFIGWVGVIANFKVKETISTIQSQTEKPISIKFVQNDLLMQHLQSVEMGSG